jgi:mxaA protein
MRAMRIATMLCVALGATGAAGAEEGGGVQLDVATPRDSGYVIGDKITHHIALAPDGNYRLDAGSLPAAGRIDQWLELHPPRVETHGRCSEIDLTYQLINVPDTTRTLVVPRQTLYIADGERRVPLFVPEWSFTVAPIVPASQRGAAARYNLRPERLPPSLDVASGTWRLAVFAALWLAVTGWLAWLQWGVPWRARRARPFTQALRCLRRMRREPWDPDRQREALRVMQAALDRTAGCTLLPSNVDELFRARPALEPQRAPIATLLEQSRQLFFGAGAGVAPPTLADVLALCRACRDVEGAAT